jgi:hypothetical protein
MQGSGIRVHGSAALQILTAFVCFGKGVNPTPKRMRTKCFNRLSRLDERRLCAGWEGDGFG